MHAHQAALPTGALRVRTARSALPPEILFTFAARRNPRRTFLFLSKVLGKHLPTAPDIMADTHMRLAALVPEDLPQPALFIGMAETATALGQGIFEAWLKRHPGAQAFFLHSTRYHISGAQAYDFAEAHSHAPRQWLMLPREAVFQARLACVRSLVLVDDEISTGRTLLNLAQLCCRLAPALAHVHLTCLTDFSGRAGRAVWRAGCPVPASCAALLHGRWHFMPHTTESVQAVQPEMPAAQSAAPVVLADPGLGRCGIEGALPLDEDCVGRWVQRLGQLPHGAPVLVLGTGEFMFPAFKLAQALQQRTAARILVGATTRSPIEVWGAITEKFSFADNYGEGIPNFLYNFRAADWACTIICHETPENSGLRALAQHTRGALLHFDGQGVRENLEFCPQQRAR